jgi:predicted ATPase
MEDAIIPDTYTMSKLPEITNWHVITGGPCSGKTSVINALSDLGHQVVHEVARAHIDALLNRGETLETIKADPLVFEREILTQKMAIERRLPPNKRIYLDRAVPDSIAYYQIEGLDAQEPLKASRSVRYGRVFLFEPLPFIKDAVRVEDHILASRIEKLLARCYTDLGYRVIRVPVLTVAQRTAYVIRNSRPD